MPFAPGRSLRLLSGFRLPLLGRGMALRLLLALLIVGVLAPPTMAQTQTRRGILLLNQVRELAARDTTLSGGQLTDLQTDSNFEGSFAAIVNDAANLLQGYRVVQRGGFFPENRGIPREQQLTVAEVVYHIYSLPNGKELFLYRTPNLNTAQYFIRRKN